MLIKTHFPEALLIDIVAYMQTASHIEWAPWQSLCLIDPRQLGRAENEHSLKVLKSKRIVKKLLEEYRAAGKTCPEPIAKRIAVLAELIDQGLPDRNLVAHGAFLRNPDTEEVTVWRFTKSQLGLEGIQEEIVTDQLIAEALRSIDAILLEAIEINEALRQYAALGE